MYAIIDGYNSKVVENWRMHRFTAFVTATAMGAKLKRPTDLMLLGNEQPYDMSVEAVKARIAKVGHPDDDKNMDKIARWLSKQGK